MPEANYDAKRATLTDPEKEHAAVVAMIGTRYSADFSAPEIIFSRDEVRRILDTISPPSSAYVRQQKRIRDLEKQIAALDARDTPQ